MDNMANKKRIFQHIHKAIGLTPKVSSFYDDNKSSEIDIYIGVDRPDFGVTIYSTIGLSDYSIGLVGKNQKQLRAEFIGICNSKDVKFPNILATCAYNIINDKYSCKPGVVYPSIISDYYDNIEMKHIYFTTPYLWEDLKTIECDDKIITWLLAIPISDSELDFLRENGSEMLEDLFEKNDVDIFDIDRKSVV